MINIVFLGKTSALSPHFLTFDTLARALYFISRIVFDLKFMEIR
jgi:hypothetical protein